MASALFRAEVIEARRQRLAGSVVAAVPPSSRLYTAIAAAIALAIVATLAFGKYATSKTVSGLVAYNLGVAKVSTSSPGEIAIIYVKSGDKVAAGAPLLTVSTAQGPTGLSAQLTEIDNQVREIDRQMALAGQTGATDAQALRQEQKSLATNIASLGRQKAILDSQTGIARDLLARNARLAKAGAGSQRQVDDARAVLLSRQSEIETLNERISGTQSRIQAIDIQLSQRGLTLDTSRSQLAAQRAILMAQRADVSRAEKLVVAASVAGEVSDVAVEIGERVGPEKTLVTVVPQGSVIETWLYAPSSAIGSSRAGQQVRLLFDAYPYQRHGWATGTVVSISRTAVDPANVDTPTRPTEPVFRIRVHIDSMGRLPVRQEDLRPGMTLTANLVVEEKPLWQLIFGSIRGSMGK